MLPACQVEEQEEQEEQGEGGTRHQYMYTGGFQAYTGPGPPALALLADSRRERSRRPHTAVSAGSAGPACPYTRQ